MPVLLPEAVRGSIPLTDVGHFKNDAPRNFDFEIICSQWMTLVDHSLEVKMERSIDGKKTWLGYGGSGVKVTGTTNKLGEPALQFGVWWDGQAMDVRVSVDVQPAPFAWGIRTLP